MINVYVPASIGWALMRTFEDEAEAEAFADDMLTLYIGCVKRFQLSTYPTTPSAWYVGSAREGTHTVVDPIRARIASLEELTEWDCPALNALRAVLDLCADIPGREDWVRASDVRRVIAEHLGVNGCNP